MMKQKPYFSNKTFYTLVVIGILIVTGIGVYAYNSGMSPSVMGHSADEIEGVCKTDGTGCPSLPASKITQGTFTSGTYTFPVTNGNLWIGSNTAPLYIRNGGGWGGAYIDNTGATANLVLRGDDPNAFAAIWLTQYGVEPGDASWFNIVGSDWRYHIGYYSGGVYHDALIFNGAKATFPGGIDPPYVSFSDESHQSIKEFAKNVEDHEKVMQFWNGDSHRMEIYDISEDKFYTMTGELIEE